MSSSCETTKRRSLPSFEEMMSAAEREIPLLQAEDGVFSAETASDAQGEADPELAAEQLRKLRAQQELKKTQSLCEDMRKAAEEEAAKLKAEAAEEIKTLKERAQRETAEKLQARYEQELSSLRSTLDKAAQGLAKEKDQLFSVLQERLLDECVKIAESILHYELDKNDDAYLSIINHALDMMRSDELMVLHMPPISYERLFGGRDNTMLAAMNERQIKVVKDIDVAEGDCLVTGERGGLRVGAHTQSARLREAVLQQWGEVKK